MADEPGAARRPKRTARDLGERARYFVEHFACRAKRSEEAHLGLELARWWLRLIEDPSPDPRDVKRLMGSLETRADGVGRAWRDLSDQVWDWARRRSGP